MDALHLLATNDPEDENRPTTVLQKSLSRTLSRKDDEAYGSLEGHSTSPYSVYVDELSGSDTAGNGSPMQPYQSIKGALRNRHRDQKKTHDPRPLAIFVKRRVKEQKIAYWMPATAEAEKISPIPLSKFKTVERRGEQAAQQAKEAEAREAQEEMDAEGNKKEGGFLKRLFSRKS